MIDPNAVPFLNRSRIFLSQLREERKRLEAVSYKEVKKKKGKVERTADQVLAKLPKKLKLLAGF